MKNNGKKCKLCRDHKPATEFYNSRTRSCKQCTRRVINKKRRSDPLFRKKRRAYYAKNKDRILAEQNRKNREKAAIRNAEKATEKANDLARGYRICTRCKIDKPFSEYYGKKTPLKRCNVCVSEAHREYRQKNGNVVRAWYRKYGRDNKEKVSKWRRRYQSKLSPEVRKTRSFTHKLSRYGITKDQWEKLYAEQNGLCRICRKKNADSRRRLGVDHDERTGVIRGLLCTACNFGIGYLQHDPIIFKAALRYLKINANIKPIKSGRAWVDRFSPSQIRRMPASQLRKFGIEK